jgi:hypothetical protein
MSQWLKQPTAVTVKLGPFVDNVDGYTAETGLTITQAEVRLSKNGGDMAQKNEATSLAHDELGYYDCLLNTTIGDDSGRRVTPCGPFLRGADLAYNTGGRKSADTSR